MLQKLNISLIIVIIRDVTFSVDFVVVVVIIVFVINGDLNYYY